MYFAWTSLCIIVSLARSECQTLTGLVDRYDHVSDSSCFTISGSFFSELLSLSSAAICSTGAALDVQTSSFYHVYTTGNAYGSAITKLGTGALTVNSCCIRECSNEWRGLAICLSCADGGNISLTSFDGCGTHAPSTGRGTIYQEIPMMTTYISLNVSSTSLYTAEATVSGLEADWRWGGNHDARFTISFSNFKACDGEQVVLDRQEHSSGLSTVDSCNFLLTSVGVAILTADLAGMAVTNCIFSNLPSANIFSLAATGLADDKKFRFTNCVFPAELTNPESCVLIGDNAVYPGPTSLFLTFFETELCPTATATRSQSPNPSRTPPPTPIPQSTPCTSRAMPLQSPSPDFTLSVNQFSKRRSMFVSTSWFLFFGFDFD
jgi:hypothetical protein